MVVSARTTAGDRANAIRDMERGDVRLLVNCVALGEGTDIPSAEVCILARKCGHVGIFLQICGRVLRPAPGKASATLIDLTGASMKHGLPTSDRVYSLDGRGISGGAAPVRACLKCGCVMEPGGRSCEFCGERFIPGIKEMPKIWDMELREVYDGSETPVWAMEKELRRLVVDRGIPLWGAAKEFEKLFGAAPPEQMVKALPRETLQAEYIRNRDRGIVATGDVDKACGRAAHIHREATGEWPPWEWRRLPSAVLQSDRTGTD